MGDNALAVPRVGRLSIGVILLNAAAAMLAVIMGARLFYCIVHESRLTHESGVWIGLALDAAHGVIYRPLMGPLGYGGTRYFPLQFILHGALIRCGLSPIHAGFVILIGSLALLLSGLFLLMRHMGVTRLVAAPLCVLATATAAAEMALTMIRGDLLSVALNVTAIALCVPLVLADAAAVGPLRRNLSRIIAAAVLFAFAFLSKETTVAGVVAVLITLWLKGGEHRRASYVMALVVAAVSGMGLLSVQLASHGNFLANLHACADGGDMPWAIRHLFTQLISVCVVDDPIGFVILVLGIQAVCAVSVPKERLFARVWFAVTAGLTLLLFLTPGIDRNHLLDVQIVCLVLIATQICNREPGGQRFLPAIVVLMLAASPFAFTGLKGDLVYRDKSRKAFVSAAIDRKPGPLLTDYALLPILTGQRPYLLDDFMLAVICVRQPAIRDDLYRRLDDGYFSTVILKTDPTEGYRIKVWGDDFVRHLNVGYAEGPRQGNFLIYNRRVSAAK